MKPALLAAGLSVLVWAAGCTTCDSCDRAAGVAGAAGETGGASGVAGAAAAGGGGAGGAPLTTPLPAGACRPTAANLGTTRLFTEYSGIGPKLVLRRATLYLSNPAGGIYRAALSSGALERIVDARAADFLVADLNLYYLEGGALWRASLAATDDTPNAVAMMVPDRVQLVGFDEMHLYLVESGVGLSRVAIADGASERLAAVAPGDARVRGGSVYYADRTAMQVMRVPVDGGPAKPVTTARFGAIGAVEAGSDHVYLADAHVVYVLAEDAPDMPRALAVSPLAAAGREGPIRRLLLSGDRLFFADDAHVGWVATDGATCAFVAAGAEPSMVGWDVAESRLYLSRPASGNGREVVRFDL